MIKYRTQKQTQAYFSHEASLLRGTRDKDLAKTSKYLR